MNRMPNERLIGEHARRLGKRLLDLIGHNYRQEEHHDIWEAFTDVCREGLVCYAVQANRLEDRLRPGRN
jgi:hypothetical protein